MTIQDQTELETLTIPSVFNLSQEIIDVAVEQREHTVKDFLGRYRLIAQGTIPAGGNGGDIVLNLPLLELLLQLQTVREKLKGFTFLRCPVKLRILYSITPTTSGGVRVIQAPDIDAAFLLTLLTTQLRQSQFPNQVFPVSVLPNVEVTLPWISQYTHRNLTNDFPTPQHYILALTSPLSHPISYVAYAAMDTDDPEFSLTQATPAVPFFDTFALSKEEEKMLQEYRNRQPESRSTTEARATSGGLSGITGMIGNVASTLSGIPVIGSIASTIAPIANLASGIFSAFGFSRPNNEEPTKVVKLDPLSSHVNCDNTHTTHTFGVQMLNKVEHLDGAFGTNTDDMSIAKIVRRPNLIGSFSYSTSSPFRSVLFAIPVSPFMGCDISLPSNAGTDSIPWRLTHQAFVAAMFRNWLASIVFNIHIFCNSFQNSKLRFVIAPSHFNNSIAGLSIDDSNSVVVNFGSNTSHQIKFPEVTNRLFLQCATANYSQPGIPLAVADENNSLGTFFILLEAPLHVTSDVVTPTVYGIIESFMTDSRFFAMSDLPLMPGRVASLRDNEKEDDVGHAAVTSDLPPISEPVVSSQVDEKEDNTERVAISLSGTYAETNLPSSSDTVAHNIVTATNLDANKNNLKAYSTCSGEAIISLRQIATQFTAPTLVEVPSPTNVAADGTVLTVIRPFISLYTNFVGAARYVDKLDYISSLYCFRRGSMHVRIMSNRSRKMLFGTLTSLPMYANGTAKISSFLPEINNANTIVNCGRHIPVPTDLEGVMDFHVPYYQPYHCVRNTPANSVTANNNAIPHAIIVRRDVTDILRISRAIGDDFSYGYIISLPDFEFYRGISAIQPPPPL